MAILRAELQGRGNILHQKQANGTLRSVVSGIYDGIVESTEDLSLPEAACYAAGGLFLCKTDHKVYVKTGSGEWEAV